MADCKRCGRDIEDLETMTCSKNPIAYQDGEYLPRAPYDDNETERCSVCHVMAGGLHHDGRYMERCPRCGHRTHLLWVCERVGR